MTYKEALDYLYHCAPMFQNIGAGAYKEGLQNTELLDQHFGHPHRRFQTIHIAGTNGKGSCAHTLSAILQMAGYRVGLYTSPHLTDFRERIRVNGEKISKKEVASFVEREAPFFEPLHPSFFEVTTALAFYYFAKEKVDIGVIEVGMGGRLDCTNIINPILSIITNISLDHTQFLGGTLGEIAREKAGIIKLNTPVVIGETQDETAPVFIGKAKEEKSPISFADAAGLVTDSFEIDGRPGRYYHTTTWEDPLWGELGGEYQIKNTRTILLSCQKLREKGVRLDEKSIREGFAHVRDLTGLRGRWDICSSSPDVICDSGHNYGGLLENMRQLSHIPYSQLHMVIGFVKDKDIERILTILPSSAKYYFTKASVERALDERTLQRRALAHNLKGDSFPTVAEAYARARLSAKAEDVIYVGGSNFIVADFFIHCMRQ